MSDQCKFCDIRGNYEKCIKTECFHHENWINKIRIKKIKELEKKYQELAQHHNEKCTCLDIY
jgi:hypothetical protein